MALTQKECAKLFEKHNRQYRGMFADVNVMGAIAMAESGGDPNAENKNTNGSIDRGLWQINSVHSDLWKKYDLRDPEQNAEAAAIVFSRQGYGAWVTFKSKSYEKFMPDRSLGAELKKPVSSVKDIGTTVGNSVREGVNAITETWVRMSVSAGALAVAGVLFILGVIILLRTPASKVVSNANPVGKVVKTVNKVG